MAGFDLVLLPFYDWKKCEALGFRVRSAHFIENFARHPSIRRMLIVGRPTTPPEMLMTRRGWRPRKGVECYRKGWSALSQVGDKVFSLDTLIWDCITPLRLRWNWWAYSLRLEQVIKSIQDAEAYLGMDSPVLAVDMPVSAGPVGRLNERLVVFLATDNWLRVTTIGRAERKEVQAGYDLLLKRSDIVIANSDGLKQVFAQRRQDVHVVPNGVTVSRFAGARSVPPDLARIPRPWVGYYGTMTKRVDAELVAWLARQRPAAHFVFIGRVMDREALKPMFPCPNVHFLGEKHYDVLPDYSCSFDVAIIPHAVGEYENEGDSIKVYEYLAAGKPVVSTCTSDINPLVRGAISLCNSREEFLGELDRYLQIPESERAALGSRLRSSVPDAVSWENLTQQVVSIIEPALGRTK